MDDDEEELSDAEFLAWAGERSERWALLSRDRREAWLEHLIARIRATPDDEERAAHWRLAYVIACADARNAA
jgi:hypothetical protein